MNTSDPHTAASQHQPVEIARDVLPQHRLDRAKLGHRHVGPQVDVERLVLAPQSGPRSSHGLDQGGLLTYDFLTGGHTAAPSPAKRYARRFVRSLVGG